MKKQIGIQCDGKFTPLTNMDRGEIEEFIKEVNNAFFDKMEKKLRDR